MQAKPQLPDTTAVSNNVLMDVICGTIGYPAIYVAHDIGLFVFLAQQPKTLADICNHFNLSNRAANAILSVNTAMGLLRLDSQKRYMLGEVARLYLLPDSPVYFGAFLDLAINNEESLSITSLKKAMYSNTSQAYDGEAIFEKHALDENHAKAFTRAMHSASMAPAMHWPGLLDLSSHKIMLDVGGGSGAHTIGALHHWKQLDGIVLDIPPVCEIAAELSSHYDLGLRFSVHDCDMWEDPFPDADVHFYSQIYHDWPEEKCEFLTRKSYEALPSGGRIILHELLYNDDKSGPFMAAASSIGMLLWTEGRQYSGQELTQMLQAAGFADIEIVPAFGYWSVISGRKP